MKINYHGRIFKGVSNTSGGQVSEATLFHYQQHGDFISAVYKGGSVHAGHLMGLIRPDNSLEFVYHHMDIEGNLKNGVCKSTPEILEDGRIRLHESWKWSHGSSGEGQSIVEEIT